MTEETRVALRRRGGWHRAVWTAPALGAAGLLVAAGLCSPSLVHAQRQRIETAVGAVLPSLPFWADSKEAASGIPASTLEFEYRVDNAPRALSGTLPAGGSVRFRARWSIRGPVLGNDADRQKWFIDNAPPPCGQATAARDALGPASCLFTWSHRATVDPNSFTSPYAGGGEAVVMTPCGQLWTAASVSVWLNSGDLRAFDAQAATTRQALVDTLRSDGDRMTRDVASRLAAAATAACGGAGNTPPTITLRATPGVAVSPGVTVTVEARASDLEDPPEKLRFRWTSKDVATGQIRTASRNSPRVRFVRDADGRWEITCVVTDSQGASAKASVEIVVTPVSDPSIEKVSFVPPTAWRHHAEPYWRNGTIAIRRGEWATMTIDVTSWDKTQHMYKVYVDGEQIHTGKPGSAWAAESLGGTSTQRSARIFVPPDVAIGNHEIEVAIFRRADQARGEAEKELGRKSMNPAPLVLFNPWISTLGDISVNAGSPRDSRKTSLLTLGTQDFVAPWTDATGATSLVPYDVTPADSVVVKIAGTLLADMKKQGRDRSRAESVVDYFAENVGGMIEGLWPDVNDPNGFAGGVTPFEWRGAEDILSRFAKRGQPVQFGQCWVFGYTLTSLLRSVGIPTRGLTTLNSGHDQIEPWGLLVRPFYCATWNSKDSSICEKTARLGPLERWGFHVWNEVWLPAVNPTSGWAMADATRQERCERWGVNDKGERVCERPWPRSWIGAPGRHLVPAVTALPLGERYPDGRDEVFLFTETNLPWRDTWTDHAGTMKMAAQGSPTATAALVVDGDWPPVDELRNYLGTPLAVPTARAEPPRLRWPGGFVVPVFAQERPALAIDVPAQNPVWSAIPVTLRLSGVPDRPLRLGVLLVYTPAGASGGADGSGAAPQMRFSRTIQATPRNGQWTDVVQIPAEAVNRAGMYEVVVGYPEQQSGPTGRKVFGVSGLPITLTVPNRVAAGQVFQLSAELSNPTSRTAESLVFELRLPGQFQVVDGTTRVDQPLPPGGRLSIHAAVQANAAGQFVLRAASDGSFGPSSAVAPITVTAPVQLFVDRGLTTGVVPGQAARLSATVVHSGVERAGPLEAALDAVDGVEIGDGTTRRLDSLEVGGEWKPEWQVRARAPGVYELPVRVTGPEGTHAETTIVLVAGGGDAEASFAASDDFGESGPAAAGLSGAMKLGILGGAGVVMVLALVVLARRRHRHRAAM